MRVNIKSAYDYGTPVTVKFDDLCNHAGAEEEERPFAAYSFYADAGMDVPDDAYTEPCLVCDKCGMFKREYGTDWEFDTPARATKHIKPSKEVHPYINEILVGWRIML